MNNITWLDTNQIKVTPPAKPKKMTGTRLGAVLGVSPWSTPFKVWCEMTKTHEEPFEDSIYTIAGKTIEPKQAEYVKKAYFLPNLITPTDVYGEDYFKKTYGDFFKEEKIFGGMWDYLVMNDKNTKPVIVIECKTTKRVEDWKDDIPEYYALQGAGYAYKLKVDEVYMVVSFLKETDYAHPEKFKCSVKNTKIINFKVSERYPDMKDKMKKAEKWYRDYVLTGISPEYDEVRDADILKVLRKSTINPTTDMDALLQEADTLMADIEKAESKIADKVERLKNIKDQIKQYAQEQFKEGDKSVELKSDKTIWVLTKSTTTGIDKEKLKKDGLFDKYSTITESYKLTNKENK